MRGEPLPPRAASRYTGLLPGESPTLTAETRPRDPSSAPGPPAGRAPSPVDRADLPPARRQYFELKDRHPDALLLFRMGDFYETFDHDAEVAAAVLGIALTSRPMGKEEGRVPLAGIPVHALDRYLDRLVAAGHRVAIAEQVSAPGNGLVDREIVRVVTPGTVEEGSLLHERGHNWLAAAQPAADPAAAWGVACCDVTTGELEVRLVPAADLAGEWARLRPAELLLPWDAGERGAPGDALPAAARALLPQDVLWSGVSRAAFAPPRARRALCEHLGVASLDGYGLEGLEVAVGAAGALVHYLADRWPGALAHLRPPRAVRGGEAVYLDPQTRRNLDLFSAARTDDASLVRTLDRTETAPGGRLLRRRLAEPLRDRPAIERRLDAVEAFVRAPLPRAETARALRGLPDIERLLGRVRAGTAHARHLSQLGAALARLPAVRRAALAAGQEPAALAPLDGVGAVAARIARTLSDDPPAELAAGGTIRPGFDDGVDALRRLATDARGALAALEAQERAATGIAALKVGHNRVLGYYLEVPRRESARIPDHYEHRQTLTAAVRYRHDELVELEAAIVSAADRLLTAEQALLATLCADVAAAGRAIEAAATALAAVDVARALGDVAAEYGYVRPELAERGPLVLHASRHPVVERRLPPGDFVPNDCALGAAGDTGDTGDAGDDGEGIGPAPAIVVLTGPNMGGKSTYLRQVALCVLLAQCGSFVPAVEARVPVVDRIFSRVGAHDDIAHGQSTFMVEMLETAQILHNATERSLVILDEVGRGTSTYDGLAIARAVIEYLHDRPGGAPRTIFATHYHELTALATELAGVANRSVAVSEEAGSVVFLHRIVPGGADRSYGVHVAELAGLPPAVITRARRLLDELERDAAAAAGSGAAAASNRHTAADREPEREAALPATPVATPIATLPATLHARLRALDPDALSPREAHALLYELGALARSDEPPRAG